MRRKRAAIVLGMSCILMASAVLQGCQQNPKSGKVEIELVQYKPEAVDIFEQLEKEFNETHDDIHLKISSPNDATTILKTRFIREDYPDIIGIGGDINYSYFVDSGILADLSDYEGLGEAIANGDMASINEALEKMTKGFLTAETADAKSLERQTSNLKEEVANMKTALKNGMPGVTQEQIDQLENLVNESEKEWQKAIDEANIIQRKITKTFAYIF